MKTCTGCKQTKSFTEFHKNSKRRDGHQSLCKVCMKATTKKWKQNNREKCRAYERKWTQNNREKVKKWRQNNREKINATNKKYRESNREKVRASDRKYRENNREKINARYRERYHTDPQFKLLSNLRSLTYQALKGIMKSASTITLLGCSVRHLLDHLEKQFQPGMTWKNHGEWHVDHMMPCASFDVTDPEQQRRCCHYTNLQPMWGPENISKNDKVIYNREWNGSRWVWSI